MTAPGHADPTSCHCGCGCSRACRCRCCTWRVGALAWVARVLLRLRWREVTQNLAACYPGLDAGARQRIAVGNYRHFADLFAELIASARHDAGATGGAGDHPQPGIAA